jgi:pimeloyl-ACP methyl ester carboxylesterase
MERVGVALGVPRERIMAVADGRNDIELLVWASASGRGVAIWQSPPEVIRAARERTGTVHDDGLAQVLASLERGRHAATHQGVLMPRLNRCFVRPLTGSLAAIFLSVLPAAGAQARDGVKPTIVFVHGAFADASGFGEVTSRLQHRGYTVISPADPLRGPTTDAAYVASVLKTLDGPLVLVGHSYGGAVISEAANDVPNVKALVFLNAYALDAGESSFDISERFPGGKLADAIQPRPFPAADGSQGTDVYITPERFRAVFAADVPAGTAALMASAQRPVSLAALQEKATAPAWRTVPSWFLIGRRDQAIAPAAQRFMATRAKAHTVEVNSSHASYVSHPRDVTKLIVAAARTTR